MTHPHTPPSGSPADGGFLRTFFLAAFVLLAGRITLAVLVDPLAQFGTGLVPPVLTGDRDQKAVLFRALPSPPAAIILGSSRSKSIPPSCITARTGLPAFNFAVNGAGAEDLVAVLRFVISRQALRRVYAGVEPELLQGGSGLRQPLVASRELAPHIPGRAARRFASVPAADLFGWQTLQAAFHSMATAGRPDTSSNLVVRERDGLLRLPTEEARWREDPMAKASHIAASLPRVMARFKSFRGLDSTRVGYLRAFLREANTAGVEVVVFIPPVHPSLERAEAASRALERTVETVALLRGLERDGLLRYVETRAISHSADSTAYVDVLHFLSPVAIRVAEAIAGGEGSCALQ